MKKILKSNYDWATIIVPLVIIGLFSAFIMIRPEEATAVLVKMRSFCGDTCGVYYAIVTIFFFIASLYMAFSKYGKIKLGDSEKPEYSSFKWGMMIFTSTFAADLLFYSFCEWIMYSNEKHIEMLGGAEKWAAVFPLFHWGPLSWASYTVLIAAFGFMLHVRKTDKQKFSEGCRPILGKKVDGIPGRVIDLFAIFALIAGTSTTFSVSTPLLSTAMANLIGIQNTPAITIGIILTIAIIYTGAVLMGMNGISKLASFSTYFFISLLVYIVFLGGETRYIIESGLETLGDLVQNFVSLSTFVDPARETTFAQDWTFFYWSFALGWCIATPFFIAMISKGRTIKNTILGTYMWGLSGSTLSFIIIGHYGMAQQFLHGVDLSGLVASGASYADVIIKLIQTLPGSNIFLILLCCTMILFYCTTFDALSMVVSAYSHKKLPAGKEPAKGIRAFWAIMFVVLPIALIFSENTLYALQAVSVIAGFPIGIIVILIIFSFYKDATLYINEKSKK